MTALPFRNSDGGRADAGFKGRAGDCVTRAIALALDRPYREIYTELSDLMAAAGHSRSARNGIEPSVYKPYLEKAGAIWTPTMTIGSGCQVHVASEELPTEGRHILRLSRHLTTLIDGTIYDTHDPSRNGARCVYGYWTIPTGTHDTH